MIYQPKPFVFPSSHYSSKHSLGIFLSKWNFCCHLNHVNSLERSMAGNKRPPYHGESVSSLVFYHSWSHSAYDSLTCSVHHPSAEATDEREPRSLIGPSNTVPLDMVLLLRYLPTMIFTNAVAIAAREQQIISLIWVAWERVGKLYVIDVMFASFNWG